MVHTRSEQKVNEQKEKEFHDSMYAKVKSVPLVGPKESLMEGLDVSLVFQSKIKVVLDIN
jgi:hypothetical protein